MGNNKTLEILRGKDKIKVYIAPLSFDKNDKPNKMGTSKRSFCTECSSMLWNYHDEYPEWIYPFASTIDKPDPLPPMPEGVDISVIKLEDCPAHVPLPKGAKGFKGYGPGDGIEGWHKKHKVAPPSPPLDSHADDSRREEKKQVYYRPSLDLTLRLLRLKIDYFASPSQFCKFDHLVRSLGRDGILETGSDSVELLKQARIEASLAHLSQWLPAGIVASLFESYDLSKLSHHLANRSAATTAASILPIQSSKVQEKGAKRKPLPASRGVEALKKVNTTSMNKMTSFFKPKDGAGKK
ncbi:MAG: hypothetical protein TREMPRED_000969 [Tremellales sp. Tagirdzhanova-0007]|nr:MAG: hypothetical protein TREMPRED_000969 [Tremellales sp. Tagirdzhanova-0007]